MLCPVRGGDGQDPALPERGRDAHDVPLIGVCFISGTGESGALGSIVMRS